MRWLGGLHLRGDAALFRARLCRLWVAAAHSERQWAALCGTTGAGLSRLSVWWIRLGITPVRIVPGHPEQNGSHEQFHAVLKAATARPPAATCRAQQRRFDPSDGNTTMSVRTKRSPIASRPTCIRRPARSLPARLPPLEYPGHFEVRLVYSNGCVAWRGAGPLYQRGAHRSTPRLRRNGRRAMDRLIRHARDRSVRRTPPQVSPDQLADLWRALRQLRACLKERKKRMRKFVDQLLPMYLD